LRFGAVFGAMFGSLDEEFESSWGSMMTLVDEN